MDGHDELRAGDADRQAVGDRLRDALNEGRITLTEYDERLQRAYGAQTYGELNQVVRDLPTVAPAQRSQLATPAAAGVAATGHPRSRGWIGRTWGSWLTASLITTAIWAATSLSSGSLQGFWPIWVIGPYGAVCLAETIRKLSR